MPSHISNGTLPDQLALDPLDKDTEQYKCGKRLNLGSSLDATEK